MGKLCREATWIRCYQLVNISGPMFLCPCTVYDFVGATTECAMCVQSLRILSVGFLPIFFVQDVKTFTGEHNWILQFSEVAPNSRNQKCAGW
jgi:hypothetical protein